MPDKSISDLRKRCDEARRKAQNAGKNSQQVRAELMRLTTAVEQTFTARQGRAMNAEEQGEFVGDVGK